MNKLIITAAITGAEVTREQQPHLPLTPEEIANEAYACYKAGASIIHVHARTTEGDPTQDVSVYKAIKQAIEKKCPVIIQPTTGGAVWHTPEQRMQPLSLNPEMATLSCGTCNFGEDVFMNSMPFMVTLAEEMLTRQIKPELEVFERGMIENAKALFKKGLLKAPMHFDLVLGVPGACPGTIEDLLYMVKQLPEDATWTVAGVGRYQLPLTTMGILLGGHVRVGFEDNIYFEKGVLAKSNSDFVKRIATLSKTLGRDIASVDETREILGIKKS